MNGFSNYYKVRLTQRLICIIKRNIWYDDIYGNIAVDVDYLYDGDTPGIPLADFKAVFRSHENVFEMAASVISVGISGFIKSHLPMTILTRITWNIIRIQIVI